VGPCHHGIAHSQVADGEYGFQLWRVAENALNKQPWTAKKGGHQAWGLVMGLTTPHHKNKIVSKHLTEPHAWLDYFGKSYIRECPSKCMNITMSERRLLTVRFSDVVLELHYHY
jgi:hypothetical protein